MRMTMASACIIFLHKRNDNVFPPFYWEKIIMHKKLNGNVKSSFPFRNFFVDLMIHGNIIIIAYYYYVVFVCISWWHCIVYIIRAHKIRILYRKADIWADWWNGFYDSVPSTFPESHFDSTAISQRNELFTSIINEKAEKRQTKGKIPCCF